MKELKPIEEKWNKKRVVIGLVTLALLIVGLVSLKILVLDKNKAITGSAANNPGSVKGESTSNIPPVQDSPEVSAPDLNSTLQNQVNTIQQEISNLNLAEIASSSPQVQKVINDMKTLQNLPRDQAKSACQQICNGL
ncbi:MAG: hypothetical protein M1426_06020 [Patescibacteria group bacterium]|nr:hypothetical protein [Patescibacteria group bacterium]